MWLFNRRKWILVIGYSDPAHLYTDIKCISKNRDDCIHKACKEVYEWYKHKKDVLGGRLIYNYLDLQQKSDIGDEWYIIRAKLYEELLHYTEEFQDTNNLELTWKSLHLEIFKISIRIFSSESDFIKF